MNIDAYEGYARSIESAGLAALEDIPLCYVAECKGVFNEFCLSKNLNVSYGDYVVYFFDEIDGDLHFRSYGSFQMLEEAFDYCLNQFGAQSFRPFI